MKVVAVFDVSADRQRVIDAIEDYKMIDGLKSIKALEKAEGSFPQYCFVIDVGDDGAQETIAHIKKVAGKYWEYVSNHNWAAYRRIG